MAKIMIRCVGWKRPSNMGTSRKHYRFFIR
jgi:hypothetical protein